jgi:adenylosuccinate lyase
VSVVGLVCPLDFRYGRPEVKALFSEEARLNYLLRVEAALARAHAKLGHIPKAAADEITKKASSKHVKLERVKAIETEIRHDLMAVVKALEEACAGDAGGYVHLGATSYDAIDTGIALQLRDALDAIEASLRRLLAALVHLARKHKATVMLGRTHGQAAVPTTFGYKMIVFASEVARHLARLDEQRPRICAGKMSGAVGTGAGFGPDHEALEAVVMQDLGLVAEDAATQIVQRDRYVELVALCANVATSMEKFATEVRNLQRTEIAEAAEAFDVQKQVGSSTMAQKQNPVLSEQVSGLARLVRSAIHPAMDNAIQWHERDLANSSAERFLLPHTLILADWCVAKMADVFEGLRVDAARMRSNVEATRGLVMAESLLLAFAQKGVSRQEAHEHVRRLSMRVRDGQETLREAALRDGVLGKLVSKKEIEAALDPQRYVGSAPDRVERLARAFTPALTPKRPGRR